MKDPLRYWRTGAVAVVMAALGRQLVRRQSPYDVAETVLRIEGSAREHGMAVFARVERGAQPSSSAAAAAPAQVLVLESSQGGTPVLMDDTPAGMELPLCVTVRDGHDGRAEVLLGSADGWDAMPKGLAHDLAALSEVVGAALQG